jgi:lipoprotein-releasing system ATP-binding protein
MSEAAGKAIILRAERLTKVYRSGEQDLAVFADLNLEIARGELVALVGESGSGKTTLLHLLGALDTPTSGDVYFEGKQVSTFSEQERSVYRNTRLGFVWQMHYLLPEFSALENVMLPQLIGGRDLAVSRSRGRDLLAEVGLERMVDRRIGELSGGEQQRVALARALANEPVLILADEPTGNLDHQTSRHVMSIIEELHRSHGLSSVIATHNVEVACRASRTLRLADGKIAEGVVSSAQ